MEILYGIVGETVVLTVPNANTVQRVRWYNGQAIASDPRFTIQHEQLEITNISERDRATFEARIISTTETKYVLTYRVYPLLKKNVYVWYRDEPLTVSSGIPSARPVVWMRRVNNSFIHIPQGSLMMTQETPGNLTFVSPQLSDSGQYHAVYLDTSTGETTRVVLDITVVDKPVPRTVTCELLTPCTCSADLYPGWRRVEWFTVRGDSTQPLPLDGSKYSATGGEVRIRAMPGDEGEYQALVTYASGLLSYSCRIHVVDREGVSGLVCRGGVCLVTQGHNLELMVPDRVTSGDKVSWFQPVNGSAQLIVGSEDRFYIKRGGEVLEITNCRDSDNGVYTVEVYGDGAVSRTTYQILVEQAVTTSYIEIGYDPCWELESGDQCMRGNPICVWCADDMWLNKRCLSAHSVELEGCADVIDNKPHVQITQDQHFGEDEEIQLYPQKITSTIRPGPIT